MISGLSHNCVLKNGKFVFNSNESKIKSNIGFLILTSDIDRIYNQEKVLRLEYLIQKPISYIQEKKSYILGKFLEVFNQITYIKVKNINISNKEKNINIVVEYEIILPNLQTVAEFGAIFINP